VITDSKATAMASGWAEAFTRGIKERDRGNKEVLARLLAAITEEAGHDPATATRILRQRVEADERAIVDEAVRMMAERQSRTADWHWSSAALRKGQRGISNGSSRFRIASCVRRVLEVVDQSRRDIHQEFVGLSHWARRAKARS
jgi:hypothetical protein